MKKISKSLLVGALVLSMATPAFAAITEPVVEDGDVTTIEAGATGQEVTSEATIELPTIKVTLPTSHGFIVNPYNLEDAGQIVSAEATIKNESSVAVEVSLKSTSANIEGKDTKTKAILGLIVDGKTTTKTVELNLVVEATEDKGTLDLTGGKLNITGKNTATKLVTLNATDGEAKLSYEGKVVANPVGNPWSDADKITVNSIYSFVPVATDRKSVV